MKRSEVENLDDDTLFKLMITKYGIQKTNDLIARKSVRIYEKELNLEDKLKVKKEAMVRVLSGEDDVVNFKYKLIKID